MITCSEPEGWLSSQDFVSRMGKSDRNYVKKRLLLQGLDFLRPLQANGQNYSVRLRVVSPESAASLLHFICIGLYGGHTCGLKKDEKCTLRKV